jgi:hypothetical protein
MKRLLLSLLLMITFAFMAKAQRIRLNVSSAYVFEDNIDSYFNQSSSYNGTIKGGFQWGVGFEYMVDATTGIELKYLRQDTKAPMNYYDAGPKNKEFDLGINYILLGANNYFKTANNKVEPYIGGGLGMAIIYIKNPLNINVSNRTIFACNVKGGSNIWFNQSLGLKLQVELLTAVHSIGGGFFFSSGATGTRTSIYSSMVQFGIGGGLIYRIGKK